MKATVAVLAVALMTGCQQNSGEARLFKIDAPLGATYKFDISTQMKAVGAQGEMGFKGTLEEKLLAKSTKEQIWEVKFAVTDTNDSGVMKGAGASFQQLNGIVMNRHSDDTGQVSKMVIGEISVPNSGTPDLVFSKNPVKIGDKWGTKVVAQNLSIDVEYELKEYGKYEGVDAANIVGAYKPGQAVENLRPLVFWVDLKDGKTLSSTGAFRSKQGSTTIDVQFELKRIRG